MSVPIDLVYAPTHEWARVDSSGVATVGITQHAQHKLGDLVFAELPPSGKVVAQNDPCATLESTKAASDVYAPLAGEVVATNTLLADEPGLVNSDPYGQGWLFQIRLTNPADVSTLLSAAAYTAAIAND